MPSLLGIDSGLTVTKAVIFDRDGSQIAVARRRIPQVMPRPRFVERDMNALWLATSQAIAEVVDASGRPASDICAVAATAHGDGVYLLDDECRPLGAGILSLDSRAGDIISEWSDSAVMDEALALTGQVPHVSAPSTLLAWIRNHDPNRYRQIGHILACKDWLRFCLTGTIGTDRTEASTSFTNVKEQSFSSEVMTLYGLEDLFGALPDMAHSAELVGTITTEAARETGLMPGTPVASGLHDVTASALGIGGQQEGVVGVVAGTYSINEVVSSEPRTDARWFCRNAIEPNQWNNMSISPASTANYDWFLDTLCACDQREAVKSGTSIHTIIGAEIDDALNRPSSLLFHPFLFGSPHGDKASASFLGLRGWHNRGDLAKAVLEGIAFNHRWHIDALRDGFAFSKVRLTGGASRNPSFAQMFSDVLGLPVTVTETEEAAAWGAALCAGTSVGLFANVASDPRDLDSPSITYQPDTERSDVFEKRFVTYAKVTDTMMALWPEIDALAESVEK